ncbi:hypothetical protein IE4872_PC00430 (plasmid) [Rhizobium gallicum]|uniref:Uncharacterized protein n=2 Tax=Rhizobium TaxID=379 RepID=A0A1L5NRC3_9HYPH|nr:hypothetical protein IE4872_PC00430 [Rhizobium gallicum]TCU33533.1 hypothetical protein EV129_11538 [Rhizobium azibense]
MQIHLQRIVGAFVGSAHGAGQFYSRAVTEARDATARPRPRMPPEAVSDGSISPQLIRWLSIESGVLLMELSV